MFSYLLGMELKSTIVSDPLCLLLGQTFQLTMLQLKKKRRIQDLHEILKKIDITMLQPLERKRLINLFSSHWIRGTKWGWHVVQEHGTADLPPYIEFTVVGSPVAESLELVWEAHLFFQHRMNHEVGTKVEPASPGYVGDCMVTEVHELNCDIRQGNKVTEVAIFGRVPVEK